MNTTWTLKKTTTLRLYVTNFSATTIIPAIIISLPCLEVQATVLSFSRLILGQRVYCFMNAFLYANMSGETTSFNAINT